MALLESAFSDLAGAQRAYGLVGALSNLILDKILNAIVQPATTISPHHPHSLTTIQKTC